MGILDIPYLAKIAELSDAIKTKETIRIYDAINSSVPFNAAENINVKGFDLLLLRVKATGDISVRVGDTTRAESGTILIDHFLDIYDYFTHEKLDYYGVSTPYPGITKEGIYLVPLIGVDEVKIPVYGVGEEEMTIDVSFHQSFGGVTGLIRQSGHNDIVLDHSKYERRVYSNENKHEAYTTRLGSEGSPETEFFEPRLASSAFLEFIGHASQNVFEQIIFIHNGTDEETRIRIAGDFSEGETRNNDRITDPFITVNLPAGSGVVFCSDSEEVNEGKRARIIEVPQLRMPFWRFRITRTVSSNDPLPTTGELYVQTVRRY